MRRPALALLSLACLASASAPAEAQQGSGARPRPAPMKRPPSNGLVNPFGESGGVGGGGVAGGVVAGAAAPRMPPPHLHPHPLPPPPAAAPGREARLSSEIDAESLPLVSLPEPLDPQARPRELSGEMAPGLKLSAREGQVRSPGQLAVTMKLESAGGSLLSLQLVPSALARDFQWVTCDPHSTRPPQPLHWETLSLDARGEATWTVSDGFFDAKACRVSAERQATFKPKAVLMHGEMPLAFAVRTRDGLLVLFPGADTLVTDAMTGQAKQAKGPLARVVLPLGKGAASTAVAQIGTAKVSAFFAQSSGKGAPPAQLAPGSVVVRAEATQTVAEGSPLLLFSARVPTL